MLCHPYVRPCCCRYLAAALDISATDRGGTGPGRVQFAACYRAYALALCMLYFLTLCALFMFISVFLSYDSRCLHTYAHLLSVDTRRQSQSVWLYAYCNDEEAIASI